jgi:hypothetical protein
MSQYNEQPYNYIYEYWKLVIGGLRLEVGGWLLSKNNNNANCMAFQ